MFKKILLLVVSILTGIVAFNLIFSAIILFIPAVITAIIALLVLYFSIITFDAATGLLNLKEEVKEFKKSIEEKRVY